MTGFDSNLAHLVLFTVSHKHLISFGIVQFVALFRGPSLKLVAHNWYQVLSRFNLYELALWERALVAAHGSSSHDCYLI